MTEIAKCLNERCSRKYSCYRYTATAAKWQCYFDCGFTVGGDECEYFWEDVNGKDKGDGVSDCLKGMAGLDRQSKRVRRGRTKSDRTKNPDLNDREVTS